MMKMKQLLVATAVLAALGATLFWSNHRKPANDTVTAAPSATNAKVISLTQDDITKLEVKKKDGEDAALRAAVSLAVGDVAAARKAFAPDGHIVEGKIHRRTRVAPVVLLDHVARIVLKGAMADV